MARQNERVIQTRLGRQRVALDKVLYFPRGLMGFEDRHEFTLLQLREGAPFLILQSMDDPRLGLLVGDPYSFLDDYPIRVGDAEQKLLRLRTIRQSAGTARKDGPEPYRPHPDQPRGPAGPPGAPDRRAFSHAVLPARAGRLPGGARAGW